MYALHDLPEQVTQRLAWVLVHFVWQGAAVALLLALTLWLGRVRRPSSRYACGLIALAAMVACPVVTFGLVRPELKDVAVSEAHPSAATDGVEDQGSGRRFFGMGRPQTRPSSETDLGQVQAIANPTPHPFDVVVATTSDEARPARSAWPQAQPWIVYGWLLGVAALSLRLLLGWIGVRRLRRRVEPVPEWLVERVRHLAKALRVTRPLIHLSHRVTEAVAVGFFKPMILLPVAWVTELPPDMIEAVIAHELAHIRRGDLWVNLLQRLVETFLFYHPAVWWLSRRLRIERELCCDELAVQATQNRVRYAETLEHVGRLSLAGAPGLAHSRPAAGPLVVCIGSPPTILLNRIRAILSLPAREQTSHAWLAGLIPLALACLIGWSLISRNTAPASDEPPPSRETRREQTTRDERVTDLDPEEWKRAESSLGLLKDLQPLKADEMPMCWRMLGWAEAQSFAELQRWVERDATMKDLIEQPDKARGRPVRLRLHIRRLLEYEPPENPLGVKRMYEAWGSTPDVPADLFVVVFTELPAGMKVGEDVRLDGDFAGYFLKVMGYSAQDGKQRGVPLLVGRLQHRAEPQARADQEAAPKKPPGEEAPDLDRARQTNAVERGVQFLKSQQREDGTWVDSGSMTGGTTALATVALLQAGVKADEAVIQKALSALRIVEPKYTYVVALQTMALCAATPKPDAELIRRNVAWLEQTQLAKGDMAGAWGYSPNPELIGGDHSNSRFAAMGLDAAKRAGFEVRSETWQRVAAHWLKTQQPDGGWGYTGNHAPPSFSMTLAGVAGLATAHRHLPKDDQAAAREAALRKPHEFIAKGIDAFVANEVSTPPRATRIYACQCLERAGHLTNTARFGDVDWRSAVTQQLLKEQRDNGAWFTPSSSMENDLIATSFALMFLSGRPDAPVDGKPDGGAKPVDEKAKPKEGDLRSETRRGQETRAEQSSRAEHDKPKPGQTGHGVQLCIRGRVMIDGPIPNVPPIKGPFFRGTMPRRNANGEMIQSPATAIAGTNVEFPDDTLVISKEGGIAYVAVYLKKAPKDWKPTPPPTEPVVIEAVKHRFTPHFSFIRTGQPLKLVNSLNEAVNFHSQPLRGTPQNNLVNLHGDLLIKSPYTQSESLPNQFVSDIQHWMKGYLLALDHPFAAITDAEGRFEIRDLPPGEHHFTVWHERRGYLNKDLVVRVEDDKVSEVELKFTAEKVLGREAVNAVSNRAGQELFLVIPKGQMQMLRFDRAIKLVEGVDEKIANVKVVDPNTIRVEAVAPGLTFLSVTDDVGTEFARPIEVTIPQLPLQEVPVAATIKLKPKNNPLRHTIKNERDKNEVLAFVGCDCWVRVARPMTRVDGFDPKILDITATDKTQLRLRGLAVGKTTVTIQTLSVEPGKSGDTHTVEVEVRELSREQIQNLFADDELEQNLRSRATEDQKQREAPGQILKTRTERLKANDREAAAKLVGRWMLTLPAGFVFEAEATLAEDGCVKLGGKKGNNLFGKFAVRGDRMELVEPTNAGIIDHVWQVKSNNLLTLIVDENKVGAKYLGAKLERLAAE